MHHPTTGEVCYAITAPMVAALREIAGCESGSNFLKLSTAQPLLRRGWIEAAVAGTAPGPKTLWRLTERGATALRIASRK
jgi:hypothetical protein